MLPKLKQIRADMSNYQWYRIWNGTYTDPKFRTIARVSGFHVTVVLTVYYALLDYASQAENRGDVRGAPDEDIASALDIPDQTVSEIRQAMEGRVIIDGRLKGWEKRQPECDEHRRDNKPKAMTAAERVRKWRAAKNKEAAIVDCENRPCNERNAECNEKRNGVTENVTCNENVTNSVTERVTDVTEKRYTETRQHTENKEFCNETLRKVTKNAPDKDKEEDKEKDHTPPVSPPRGCGGICEQPDHKNAKGKPKKPKVEAKTEPMALPDWLPVNDWNEYLEHRKQLKKPLTPLAAAKAVNKLHQLMLEGHDPGAVIEQTICNGWLGLFPLHTTACQQKTPNGFYNTSHQRLMSNNRKAAEIFERWMCGETDDERIDEGQEVCPMPLKKPITLEYGMRG